MIIDVTVKPGSKQARVIQVNPHSVIIAVHERPHDGKATAAAIKSLAHFLHIAPSRISLVRGATARRKQFMID